MAKSKLLNGLPHDLVQSFFGTIRYFHKGYLSDWIVNGAIELNVNYVEIDIVNKEILPKELEVDALMVNLKDLDTIIDSVTEHAGFDRSYIKEAKFKVNIKSDRYIECDTVLVDSSGKEYKAKKYYEKSFEIFKVFNINIFDKLGDWTREKYFSFKMLLMRKFGIGRLKFTKRLENRMQ